MKFYTRFNTKKEGWVDFWGDGTNSLEIRGKKEAFL